MESDGRKIIAAELGGGEAWETADSAEWLAKRSRPGGGDRCRKNRDQPEVQSSLEPWNALCEAVMRSHGKEAG